MKATAWLPAALLLGAACESPATLATVDRIDLDPAVIRLALGDTLTVRATPRTTDGHAISVPLVWSSGDTSIARITDTGLVTAVNIGHTYVRATARGRNADAVVDVILQDETPFNVVPGMVEFAPGDTVRLNVVGQAFDFPVSWTFTVDGVASIDQSGLLTAMTPGTTVLTATSAANASRAAHVDIVVR